MVDLGMLIVLSLFMDCSGMAPLTPTVMNSKKLTLNTLNNMPSLVTYKIYAKSRVFTIITSFNDLNIVSLS